MRNVALVVMMLAVAPLASAADILPPVGGGLGGLLGSLPIMGPILSGLLGGLGI